MGSKGSVLNERELDGEDCVEDVREEDMQVDERECDQQDHEVCFECREKGEET